MKGVPVPLTFLSTGRSRGVVHASAFLSLTLENKHKLAFLCKVDTELTS